MICGRAMTNVQLRQPAIQIQVSPIYTCEQGSVRQDEDGQCSGINLRTVLPVVNRTMEGAEKTHDHPMLSPPTPSSAPSISRSPSRRDLVIGRSTGLARPICARRVGLERTLADADPKLWRADQYELEPGTMGDDDPEWMPLGMGIGIGIDSRGAPRPLNASRRWEIDGDTARRFAALGYGS